jgi:dienelactone hydrolase
MEYFVSFGMQAQPVVSILAILLGGGCTPVRVFLPFVLLAVALAVSASVPNDTYNDISAYIDQQTVSLPPPNGTRDDLVGILGIPGECLTSDTPLLVSDDPVTNVGSIEIRRWVLATCQGEIPLHGLVGIPDGDGPHPLALAIYGTAGSPARLFGLDGVDDYHHAFALRLVEAGYLTFVPTITTEPSGAANINDLRNQLHKQLVSQGSTLAGVEVGQLISALNFLEGEGNGDVLVWGISLGGFLAAHLAAIDESVDTVVVSQYFENRRQKLLGEIDYPLVYWQYENADYIIIPGYAQLFDDVRLAALIAPRSVIIEVGADDPRSLYVEAIYPAIEALPGCSGLSVGYGGHEVFFGETLAAVRGCGQSKSPG